MKSSAAAESFKNVPRRNDSSWITEIFSTMGAAFMRREREIEKSVEKKISELKHELMQDQGSAERPNFAAAATIAPPPGLILEPSSVRSQSCAGSYAALCSLIEEAKDNNCLRAAAVLATIKETTQSSSS